MRAAGGPLVTFLDSNTRAWFADLFTWTPLSGGPYYWTNWTSDLVVGGHTFTSQGTGTVPLLEVDGYKSSVGTDIETTTVTLSAGALAQFGGVRLPLAAAQGMFDGCGLLVERLFMASPGDVSLGTIHVFQGIVGEVEPGSSVVTLTVESGMAALKRVIPRTLVQAPCNNILFDAVCAAAGLTKASKTVTGTAAAGATTMVVPTSRTTDADGYFELGVITFTSGVCAGASRGVVKSLAASGQMTLDRPLPGTPANGDTFSIFPGCDKARNGGCAKFANKNQFRGFPFAPAPGATSAGDVSRWWSTPEWATPPNYSGIKLWNESRGTEIGTAGYGLSLPIVYGLQRVKGRLIYVAPPSTRGNQQSLAAQIMALCQGVASVVVRAWRNGVAGPLATIFPFAPWGGTNVSSAYVTGAATQSPWAAATANDPTSALSYPGVAYVGLAPCAYTPSDVGSRSFEVGGLFYNGLGGVGDAHPADVILDVITAEHAGAQAYSVVTDVGPDGSAASSFRRYATAENFGVSMVIDEQRPVKDVLRELLGSTNSDVIWSDGAFKIVPYADLVTVGNGVTFTPVTASQYAIGVDDFFVERDEDPVSSVRGPTIDLYNTFPVEFLERTKVTWRPLTSVSSATPDQVVNSGNIYQCITTGTTASSVGPTGTAADITDGSAHWKYLQAYDPSAAYVGATVESPDPVDVALNKSKRAPTVSAHAICNRDSAVKLSRLYARRTLYSRTVYRFRLPYRFCRLEPMDLVSLTEPTFGLLNQVVRIQTITEQLVNGAPVYEVEAAEWPVGFCSSPAHLTGSNESMNYVGTGGAEMAMTSVASAVAAALLSVSTGAIPNASAGWRAVAEMGTGTYVGRLVAIGYQGSTSGTNATAYSDSQGRSWTSANLPTGSWQAITTGLGLFVAVGTNGAAAVLATSPDGITWTTRTVGGSSLRDVKFNGAVFVSVGLVGTAYWSTNGTTWTAASLPTVNASNDYHAVGWSQALGLWLAVGLDGCSATAASAATSWTGRGIDTFFNPFLKAVAWSDEAGVFVAAGTYFYVLRDAINWVKIQPPAVNVQGGSQSTVYGNGIFVATAYLSAGKDAILYSSDGLAWSVLDVAATSGGNGMEAALWISGASGTANKFIFVGHNAGVSASPQCLISGPLP